LVLFQPTVSVVPLTRMCRSFNPTLVLFQLFSRHIKSCCHFSFQSHFGLISTMRKKGSKSNQSKLSIPLWSYFNPAHPHIDAIYQAFNPTLVLFQHALRFTTLYQLCNFQSHFGLISTMPLLSCPFESNSFQSHFGLISTMPLLALALLNHLSIPLWSYFNVSNCRV